ncbi:MAG TPA: hypothetical protein VJ817_00925, partial [Gemmatimonadales bacterium]|nr:hypothetical protein [Gemmatimonadales bacterium]
YSAQAAEAAEIGLADAFSSWSSAWNGYGIGGDSVQPVVTIPGATNVRYTNTVRRLGGGNYLVTSRGEKLDRGGNVVASRLLARLGKLVSMQLGIQAAVTSKGSPTITGEITLSGVNTTPATWTPACTGPDVYGVRSDGSITPTGAAVVLGSPQPMKPNDTAVTDATFTGPYNALLSGATIHFLTAKGPLLTGGTTGVQPRLIGSPSTCDKSRNTNWGEPDHTPAGPFSLCADYYPIVHFGNSFGPGNKVQISGGRGQGILLVDGDILLDGAFEFSGIILALGNVVVEGTGTKVHGAILGHSVSAGFNSFSGESLVAYSECAVQAALAGASTAVALNERSWAAVNPR